MRTGIDEAREDECVANLHGTDCKQEIIGMLDMLSLADLHRLRNIVRVIVDATNN